MSEEPGIGCKICFNDPDGNQKIQGKIVAIDSADGKNDFYTLQFPDGSKRRFSSDQFNNLEVFTRNCVSEIPYSYCKGQDFAPDYIGIGGNID